MAENTGDSSKRPPSLRLTGRVAQLVVEQALREDRPAARVASRLLRKGLEVEAAATLSATEGT